MKCIASFALVALISTTLSAFSQCAPAKASSEVPAANAAPRKRPDKMRVSSKVATPHLVKKVNPIYPGEARKQRISGSVIMKALISTAGDVKELAVVSGDPLLAPAALEAVKQWKYQPFMYDGQPIDTEIQIVVSFQLR